MSERDIDRLFELPPEEFTAARNELARRLKNDGRASAAADVKQLSKPSIAAWAINQLAREQRGAVKLLLGVGCEIEESSGERAQERRHGRCAAARTSRRTKGSARAHAAGAEHS